MVKIREAKYCNFKLILIYLVVYGHLIESLLSEDAVAMTIYRMIYAFHMPAFVFLSGIFSKRHGLKQAKKLLLWYAVLQGAAFVLGKATILTPYWHLWYLLSYAAWVLLGTVCSNDSKWKWLILVLSIIAGCSIGYVSWVGRELSLSRTVVFFPYYWLGRCFQTDFKGKRSRPLALLGLVFAIVLLFTLNIPVRFLYQATAYDKTQNGAMLRLFCYMIGGIMSLSVRCLMPECRLPFTKAGTDTFFIYAFHAPLVLFLQKYCTLSSLSCLFYSAAIVFIFYKLQQCSRNFCGIAGERGRRWQHFKRSTRNTPDRYIDSYSP